MHQIYVERVKKNATHTQKEVSIQKDCLIHKVDVQVFLIEFIIQLWLEAFVIVPIINILFVDDDWWGSYILCFLMEDIALQNNNNKNK